jgi:SAM-dependent methyltransferase
MLVRNDINDVVHKLRTVQLARAKKGANVFLTAGASGLWYFEWIDATYGVTPRHIAIEKYSPRPEVLPKNVDWIPESVGKMNSVGSASVDMVFSGQNIEHLWTEEIVGFLMESARVLRPGGTLVMDSPNRSITARTRDSHPEHVIEFTPEEARALAEAAGFEVEKIAGLWLATDPITGEPLPLNEGDFGAWTYERRVLEGLERPDLCFVWWLEGRRTTQPPNEAALRQIVADVYAEAWPERLRRFSTIIGERVVDDSGEAFFRIPADKSGVAMFGPYAPLIAGSYKATFSVAAANGLSGKVAGVLSGGRSVLLEIFSDQTDPQIIAQKEVVVGSLGDSATETEIAFELKELVFGVQFRAIAYPGAPELLVRARVDLVGP